MKRLFLLTLVILILAILIFVLIRFRLSQATQITILHTNDMHGAFLPTEAFWLKSSPKPLIGGFLALNAYVTEIRSTQKNTLLLDAGDIMTGNPICNIEYQAVKGGALIHFMNQIGYEGMTLGNHEFDISQANARGLIQLARFPVYSANLFTSDGQLFAPKAYSIYHKGGLRVGVIGVMTENLLEVLNDKNRTGLEVKPAAEIVEKIATEIDAETELIVVLSHRGFPEDSLLAEHLSRRVDVIVGGHSHTRLEAPRRVNGIFIVQTGEKARYLGQLDLSVAADTVQNYSGQLIPLWVEGITKDEALEKQIEEYKNIIDAKYGQVIGHLKSPWRRSHHSESNIGNFIADCLRKYTRADVAFINSGGIRKGMPTGNITLRDIIEILPFDNYICTFEMTGAELLKIIQRNAQKAWQKSDRGILQVAGLRYRWQALPDGQIKIVNASVNGKKIRPRKMYTGATIDFIVVANSQNYLGFTPAKVNAAGKLLSEVVSEFVQQQQEIESTIEGRIQESH